MDINGELLKRIKDLEKRLDALSGQEVLTMTALTDLTDGGATTLHKHSPTWTFLTTPLTSTSWDGDAHSTTSKTIIDLSAVFGVPANAKAILVRVAARDSGSGASNTPYICLSPNNTSGSAPLFVRPAGLPNDYIADYFCVVPCSASGDVYYQVVATGSETLDAWIQIWGYCV